MDECKFCGNDLDGRGDFSQREAIFCSDECRHAWHNMNKRIERKHKIIIKTLSDLYDMLNETEDQSQKNKIEKLAQELSFLSA
jgi:polyhydroxyalkanoate synthesis regulator phasin